VVAAPAVAVWDAGVALRLKSGFAGDITVIETEVLVDRDPLVAEIAGDTVPAGVEALVAMVNVEVPVL